MMGMHQGRKLREWAKFGCFVVEKKKTALNTKNTAGRKMLCYKRPPHLDMYRLLRSLSFDAFIILHTQKKKKKKAGCQSNFLVDAMLIRNLNLLAFANRHPRSSDVQKQATGSTGIKMFFQSLVAFDGNVMGSNFLRAIWWRWGLTGGISTNILALLDVIPTSSHNESMSF
jgi:hypothetical protein